MARPYRLQLENCLYHVTSRGDDRKKIYISEYDYAKFLEYVKVAKEKYRFYLYAYVLMTNHYHLLIETTQPNLSQIMQYINTSYTTYYNIKRRRTGHVFHGRYKSIVVDGDSYFLELTRYIHLNPVKAKIVDNPEQYKWSSYTGYIRRKRDELIDEEEMLNYTNLKGKRYRNFVMDGIDREINPFKNIYAGFMLGKAKFIKEKLRDLKERVENKEFSYKNSVVKCIDKEGIIRAVVARYGKSFKDICVSKRRPMREKQVLIYLMRRLTALTNREIGDILKMKYSAVSKAEHTIEKLLKVNNKVKKDIKWLLSKFEA